MNSYQFMKVPGEMMVQVIKKCYPIPYARLRQSCRFLDEFCEGNRTRLGIYNYRKDPHLLVTNSLVDSHFFPYYDLWPECSEEEDDLWPEFSEEEVIKLDTSQFYLVIDYDKYRNNTKFIIPLNRENIGRIKEALSGFAFTNVFVGKTEYYGLLCEEEFFHETVVLFLEFGAELKVKNLFVSEVQLDTFKLLANTWQLDHIFLYSFMKDMREYLQLNSVKNVPSISYEVEFCGAGFDDVNDIIEASKGKRYLRINEPINMLPKTAWIALNRIYENWTKVTDVPETVALVFQPSVYYHERNMQKKFKEGKLHLPSDAAYFGAFNGDRDHQYDIWLIEIPGYWRVVSLRRYKTRSPYAWLLVRTVTSQKDLAMVFIELAAIGGTKKIAIDFSLFYKRLNNASTVEEIRRQFRRLIDFVKIE